MLIYVFAPLAEYFETTALHFAGCCGDKIPKGSSSRHWYVGSELFVPRNTRPNIEALTKRHRASAMQRAINKLGCRREEPGTRDVRQAPFLTRNSTKTISRHLPHMMD
jgi:hypothetical protein